MSLHPEAQAYLDSVRDVPQPYECSLEAFRAAIRAAPVAAPPGVQVEEHIVAGAEGQPLRLRLYRPPSAGPHPAVVWVHGGSFVRGSLDDFDGVRRMFCALAGCVVVAVDQRRSPETQFPGPLGDVYAALVWTREQAEVIGSRPDWILLGGESSGGNLAAAAAQLAHERGGPGVAGQILLVPTLDAAPDTESIRTFAAGFGLTRGQLQWAYAQYAAGAPPDDPLLSPLRAPSLTGLPPAVVVTAEYDPSRDEGELYAERLDEAGVRVRRGRVEGMVHHHLGQDGAILALGLARELLSEIRSSQA
jgi:acetyl esterase